MRIGLRRFSSETVDRIEANSLEGAEIQRSGGQLARHGRGRVRQAALGRSRDCHFDVCAVGTLSCPGRKQLPVFGRFGHQVISGLSAFIAKEKGHRVLAAGDRTIFLRLAGEYGDEDWAARQKDRVRSDGDQRVALCWAGICEGQTGRTLAGRTAADSRNVPTLNHSQ